MDGDIISSKSFYSTGPVTMIDDLAKIFEILSMDPRSHERLAVAMRNAFDFALNGANTGRYSIAQLNKTEKTLIGTFYEAEFRNNLHLPDGVKSDVAISGIDVQIKFSLTGQWMIGPENIGEICILATASDEESTYSVGIMKPLLMHLNEGSNRDGKKTIKAAAREEIKWIVKNGKLRENILLHLQNDVRDRILQIKDPSARIHKLFELVTRRVIDATCVRTVGNGLHDPIRRVRSARKLLIENQTGLILLGWDKGREAAAALGYPIDHTEYVSVPESEFAAKGVPLPAFD